MKILILAVFTCSISSFLNAAIITANPGTGRWDFTTSWDLGRVPMGGDTIVIPAGRTIEVRNPNTVSGAAVRLNIYGTLLFPTLGADKLDLPCGSTIQIYSTGLINSTGGSNADLIDICGINIWNSTTGPNPQGGPSHSNYPSYGFTSGTLPVVFHSFEARLINNNVSLKWSTSYELNNSYFEIERSIGNIDWVPIARINSSGNSGSIQHYSYTDILNQYQKGVIFYRIKQVDFDGKNSFTAIKAVNISQDPVSFLVFPNPVKETLHIYFETISTSQKNNVLVIRNSSGQIIMQKNILQDESYTSINTSQLAKGIYYVSFSSENFTGTQKILVQ